MNAFGICIGNSKTFGVAVSGGSDSMALLVVAADYAATHGLSCLAVTVDHGLRPEAAREAQHVASACAALGIGHSILTWKHQKTGLVGQDAARQARHRLMATWAREASVATLALGHTRDDRLETFLMRARQGSGWHGLAGLMPNSCSPVWPEGRGLSLVRPLLAFGREELREELRARDVSWIEDPSNEAERFERVRMRRLLQLMNAQTRDKALRVMDGLMHIRAAVNEEASALLAQAQLDPERGTADLPLKAVENTSDEALRRTIEAVVMAAGGAERGARGDALERLLRRIIGRDPQLTGGVTLGGAKIHVRAGAFLTISQPPPRRGKPAPEKPDWQRAVRLLEAPDLRVLAV